MGLQSDAAGGIAPRALARAGRGRSRSVVCAWNAARRAKARGSCTCRPTSRAGNCPIWAMPPHGRTRRSRARRPAQIDATLAAHPDRTLSRLLAPRRLHPNRGFIAAVVPAYLSGRIAGLGEDPTGHPGARHRARARVDRARRADAAAGLLRVDIPHRRGRRLRVAGAAAARRAAGPRGRAHGPAPVAAERHGWTGRRLGSAAAGARTGGAAAAAPRGGRQRDSARRCAAARTRRFSGPRTSASRGRTRARWRR